MIVILEWDTDISTVFHYIGYYLEIEPRFILIFPVFISIPSFSHRSVSRLIIMK